MKTKQIPKQGNGIGEIFILLVIQPQVPEECCKKSIVVQEDKDSEKEYIINTLRTIRHRNIRITNTDVNYSIH